MTDRYLPVDLQQTPATSAKVSLRVFAQTSTAEGSAPETFTFQFTSTTDPRAEADAIKAALATRIEATRAAAAGPENGAEGTSAAMAIASAISSGPSREAWLDDDRLKTDVDLQRSLFKANPVLQKTFMESLRTKPDSISNSQFTAQFWSARVHLLRAHAIEQRQSRGSYNVLSMVKPRVENNVTKLNITKEQIQLIFNQHPLVKRVYDENVPKLSEEQFWSRFFQSRLLKKLRGERIVEADATDPIFDRYLHAEEDNRLEQRLTQTQVPRFIDLGGNEANASERQGNRPDATMRPTATDKVPIIRTLNSLSEKIMAQVAPSDRDPTAPIGMDEETYRELQLRDLRGDAEQDRIVLNVDQSIFSSGNRGEDTNAEEEIYAKQDPKKVIGYMRTDMHDAFPASARGQLDLTGLIGFNSDDDDSDSEDEAEKARVGSRHNLNAATSQIMSAIRDRRQQTDSSADDDTLGLSVTLFDRATLTHATTTEFLSQFWNAFLSGDPERAAEVASLQESLSRALERISVVANDAETEREEKIRQRKMQAVEIAKRTGRKVRPNLDEITGGKGAVEGLFGPTVKAIEIAKNQYQKALAAAAVMDGASAGA